jgi:ParB-like chromosome segregation protein Spo0J
MSEQKMLNVPEPQKVKLSELNFASYNPRVMPPDKMRALKASLVQHGFVLNLVVQKKGMILIGGHQRVRAMHELCAERGWPEPASVGAVVLDVDDRKAKQLNVALNNIEGDVDPYKLGELFTGMVGGMTVDEVLATGFTQENLDELVKLVIDPNAEADALEAGIGDITAFAKSVTLTVEFTSTDERDAAKAMLVEAAKAQSKKAGTVLLGLLKSAHAVKRGRRAAS